MSNYSELSAFDTVSWSTCLGTALGEAHETNDFTTRGPTSTTFRTIANALESRTDSIPAIPQWWMAMPSRADYLDEEDPRYKCDCAFEQSTKHVCGFVAKRAEDYTRHRI